MTWKDAFTDHEVALIEDIMTSGFDGRPYDVPIKNIWTILERFVVMADATGPIIERPLPTDPHYLDVPFSSQHEIDAGWFSVDCGGAVVEMAGEYYRGQIDGVGTNEIHSWMTGGQNETTNAEQLISALEHFYNVKGTKRYNVTPADLRAWIDRGDVVIILIRYGDIVLRMDLGWTGGHWVLLAGYETLKWADDLISRFFIHDPDWFKRSVGGQVLNLMPQGAYQPWIEDMLFEAMDGYNFLAIFCEAME